MWLDCGLARLPPKGKSTIYAPHIDFSGKVIGLSLSITFRKIMTVFSRETSSSLARPTRRRYFFFGSNWLSKRDIQCSSRDSTHLSNKCCNHPSAQDTNPRGSREESSDSSRDTSAFISSLPLIRQVIHCLQRVDWMAIRIFFCGTCSNDPPAQHNHN